MHALLEEIGQALPALALMWRFRRPIICLKHAPSFGDSGESSILNTRSPLMGRFRFIIFILNTPPHLAIPFMHLEQAQRSIRV